MKTENVLLLLLLIIYGTKASKILGIFPLPGHSHYKIGNSLLKELAERGHDVTMISCFTEKVPPKNGSYRDITLTGFEEKPGNYSWNMFKREGLNPFVGAYFAATMSGKFVATALNHTNVQKLLKSGETFDVVIADQFLSDGFKALSTYFKAPLILMSPMGPNFWIDSLTGNPAPPSYIPDIMLGYSVPMTFCERLVNSLIHVFNQIIYNVFVYPQQNEFIKQFIPNGPDIQDVLYNASLVLVNYHSSLNRPVPKVPAMIEVGGFHMKPPKKLPKDLQEFMDSAEDGVVYFSMGSNLKGVLWPIEKREAFIKAFSKLKQKVLWKWEDDVLPGKSENIKISKWVPQQDLLSHPNLKLFITHGGFVSSVETAYHGVPVLVLPIFGDQKMNANFAYQNGFGRFITYKDITEETLLENINEILNNSKYKENAIKRAKIFHDREVHPMDTAVYWVEYVIRHRGAPHLRVAGLDLPWYKYHLLDVIGFITAIWLFSMFVCWYLIKKIYGKMISKKTTKLKKH